MVTVCSRKNSPTTGVYYIRDDNPLILLNENNVECFLKINADCKITLMPKRNSKVLKFSTKIPFEVLSGDKKEFNKLHATNRRKAEDFKDAYLAAKKEYENRIQMEQEAREKLNELFRNKRRLKCSELQKEFVADRIRDDKTEKSIKNINTAFREFIRICSDKYIYEYELEDLEKFIETKKQDTGKKWAGRKYKISLQAAFNYALDPERGIYLEKNLWLHKSINSKTKLKSDEYEPNPFSKVEYKCILAVVDNAQDIEIIQWAVQTGMRQGEIIFLKVSDVSIYDKIIEVKSNDEHRTKSGKSREIELADALIPSVIKAQQGGQTYIFETSQLHSTINPASLSKRFKKYVRKALSAGDKRHFHDLRSTFACWLLEEGVSLAKISAYLGHSSVLVTEKCYAKWISRKNKFSGEVNFINNIINQPFTDSEVKEMKIKTRLISKWKYVDAITVNNKIANMVKGLS